MLPELSSKNGVGWSQRPRIPEIVLKVVTRRDLEGGQRLEEGVSLANTVGARDRPAEPPNTFSCHPPFLKAFPCRGLTSLEATTASS